MNKLHVQRLLERFLIEDIGDGDLTAESIFPDDQLGSGHFIFKKSGILAGIDLLRETYHLLDPSIYVETHFKDGDFVEEGAVIANVHGPIQSLLSGERVILNLLQRLSGIASLTKHIVYELDDDTIQICDTRKTTPGLRILEKYAVTCGDGYNHRFGLYDGVMIKDNHIAFCGSITEAVQRVREKVGHMVKIEVETETKEQVLEAIEAKVDVIMFDNRTPSEIKEFVKLVPSHIVTEVSGGITPESIVHYRGCGVDRISIGFLTHSVRATDISFLEQKAKFNTTFTH